MSKLDIKQIKNGLRQCLVERNCSMCPYYIWYYNDDINEPDDNSCWGILQKDAEEALLRLEILNDNNDQNFIFNWRIMTDFNFNHNLTDNIWHISNYVLFAENPDNENEIYCVNLLKCNCFILTKEEFKLLFKINDPKKSVCIPKKFIDYGLIVNFDEYSFLRILFKKEYKFSGNLSLSLCPTLNCNFRCPYCFEKHRPGKLSLEVQDNIIEFINKMSKVTPVKKLNITWFGGEPLLYPDIIESFGKRLILFAKKNEIIYNSNIITNGYLLNQEIADLLFELKVNHYQITLDGLKNTHDKTRYLVNGGPTFDRIVENLKNVKIKGNISIRHNISESNYKDIPLLKNFVNELKIKSGNNLSYYFSDVTCNDNVKKNKNNVKIISNFNYGKIKILYDNINFINKNYSYCGAQGLNFFTIDEEGRLFKCRDVIGINELSFGNIKTWNPLNPFLSATNPNVILPYITNEGIIDDKECKKCIWLPQCLGGCPHQRLFYNKRCFPYKNIPKEYVIAICKKYLYNKK